MYHRLFILNKVPVVDQKGSADYGSVAVKHLSVSWDTVALANPTLSDISFEVPEVSTVVCCFQENIMQNL